VQPVSLYAAGQERATTSSPAATRAAMPSALVPLLLRVCQIVGVVGCMNFTLRLRKQPQDPRAAPPFGCPNKNNALLGSGYYSSAFSF